MKRLIIILIFMLLTSIIYAQSIGRIREKRNQKKLQSKIRESGWSYRKTPGKKSNDVNLFHRNRTYGKTYRSKIQSRINRERNKRRIHGNDVFSKRKYY